MNELDIKKRLLNIFKKDFEIKEVGFGINFFGKRVVPDIIMKLRHSNYLIIIEIKDDRCKNFKLNELLRQGVTYKYSTYDGYAPDLVLVTTFKWLKKAPFVDGAIGLASKLGVGFIGNFANGKQLRFRLGSKVYYRYNIKERESEYYFHSPTIKIGTNHKSNKISL